MDWLFLFLPPLSLTSQILHKSWFLPCVTEQLVHKRWGVPPPPTFGIRITLPLVVSGKTDMLAVSLLPSKESRIQSRTGPCSSHWATLLERHYHLPWPSFFWSSLKSLDRMLLDPACAQACIKCQVHEGRQQRDCSLPGSDWVQVWGRQPHCSGGIKLRQKIHL